MVIPLTSPRFAGPAAPPFLLGSLIGGTFAGGSEHVLALNLMVLALRVSSFALIPRSLSLSLPVTISSMFRSSFSVNLLITLLIVDELKTVFSSSW